LDGSAVALDLLAALTAADAIATGPGAVSEWKSALIADLVARVHGALGGQPVPARCPITAGDGGWTAPAGELSVHIGADRVLIAAPDAVGVLYRTAGVLALHGVDVRAATITSRDGTAVNSFVVTWRFGRPPDAGLLRTDLARALDGRSDLAERLRDKERTYRREDRPGLPPVSTAPPLVPPVPTVHWFDGEATDATVLEVRAEDAIGLLCRIAAALERSGLDVRAARVASFGGSVVDSFYVTTRDGGLVPVGLRREVEIELRSV
jgi:[protein-PII] uridylyltransferase